ncbi:M48 family metalloprotease [Methylovulum psychrotolerans]|uniref:M48 family metallopeptidase n=1 Tax=Methylovulum psychrotolerans TaxID=1704499 RepID=UPI001BFFB3A9|nr:M48 family metallopeptidase [Methylovulum psychrotolerans]MBT9096446.1 M48 family metalloprotease [Methylovulum psychrotolerans]
MLDSFLFLLAVSPGLFAWWHGRKLIRQAQQPLLAERYTQYLRKLVTYFWLILALVMFTSFVEAKSGLQVSDLTTGNLMSLVILSLIAGYFPSRKALLQESWGFLGFLSFQLRWLAVFQSFPLLLFFIPQWIAEAGANRPLIIAVLAVLLYGRLLLTVGQVGKFLGATLMTDPKLLAGFEAINARSTVTPPSCFTLPMRGGRMANALAFAASPKPTVLFTETLLSELSPEQIEAIYAHELGHLEHRDARFIRRYTLQCFLLATIALACVPLVAIGFTIPPNKEWLFMFVGIALLLLNKRFHGHHRGEETHSDTRAVELCGNPEAMKTGLQRIHDINLLPHRWSREREQASTHPSLANRIRSIQAVDGQGAEPVFAPMIIATSKAGSYVVFADSVVYWLDGVPEGTALSLASLTEKATQQLAVAYTELVELLLEPSGHDQALLVGIDQQGKSYRGTLPAAMIGPAQAALAYADQHIVPMTVVKPSRPLLFYLLTAGIVACVYFSGQPYILLAVIAFVYWLQPSRMLLATVGALAFAQGMVYWLLNPMLTFSEQADAFVIGFTLLGLAAAAYALYQHFRSPTDGQVFFLHTVGILGIIAAIGLVKMVAASFIGGLFALYVSAFDNAFTGVCLFGLAVICATRFKGERRWLAGLLAFLAVSTLVIQSPYFGERVAHDPFVVSASQLRPVTANVVSVAAIAEPDAFDLRLSPQGQRIAFMLMKPGEDGDYDDSVQTPFTFTDFNEPPTTLAVVNVEFIDDGRILTLTVGEPNALQLRQWRNGSWVIDKQWQLPAGFATDEVIWDNAKQSWILPGYDTDTGNTVRVFGTLANDDVKAVTMVTNDFENQRYSQYDLQDSVLRIYWLKAVNPKPSFWSSYFLQQYATLSIYQNNGWSDIARTAADQIICLPKSLLLVTTQMPCLYRRADNQFLGIVNLQSGRLDKAVLLARDANGYNLIGQQGAFILLSKNSTQLFAVHIDAGLLYELALPESAKPFDALAWNGHYLALANSTQGVRVFRAGWGEGH